MTTTITHTNIGNVMVISGATLTFADMTRVEPALAALECDILTAEPGPDICDGAAYGREFDHRVLPRLRVLVGRHARCGQLMDESLYDAAYQHLASVWSGRAAQLAMEGEI